MLFNCISKKDNWTGRIGGLKYYGSHYEMIIESRSRIHVLFGKTKLGAFACMPDFGVGCHIGGLRDYFWNREKLIHVLGEIDGLTVASAFEALADDLSF